MHWVGDRGNRGTNLVTAIKNGWVHKPFTGHFFAVKKYLGLYFITYVPPEIYMTERSSEYCR